VSNPGHGCIAKEELILLVSICLKVQNDVEEFGTNTSKKCYPTELAIITWEINEAFPSIAVPPAGKSNLRILATQDGTVW